MRSHLKAWLATLVILDSAREFSASTALVCRLNRVAVIAAVSTTAARVTPYRQWECSQMLISWHHVQGPASNLLLRPT